MAKKRQIVVTIISIVVLLLASCKKEDKNRAHYTTKHDLIEYNKMLVKRDSTIISNYCKTQNLDTIPSNNGIWLTIHEKGDDYCLQNGDVVDFSYTISDISGVVYYTSERLGNKRHIVGSGQDINGLDIALLKLHPNSKATFIAMPDLAYGLLGDDNKIKGRRIIRYDINIVNVNK